MRLRCWSNDPPCYTLDLNRDVRIVLDCPAELGSDVEWLEECANATALLLSDHTSLGAMPLLTERSDFDGAIFLSQPTAVTPRPPQRRRAQYRLCYLPPHR